MMARLPSMFVTTVFSRLIKFLVLVFKYGPEGVKTPLECLLRLLQNDWL
jgi:hypothetical protein